jgi:hypothetical protein
MRSLALLVLLVTTPLGAPAFAQSVVAAPGAEATDGAGVLVRVNGLVCDFCTRAVEQTFKRRPEIAAVSVDLGAKTVRLSFKPGRTLAEAKIKDLITRSGYAFVSMERFGEQS